MKVDQAKQIASNAIEQLRQALEAGHSERLKEYLAAMARFDAIRGTTSCLSLHRRRTRRMCGFSRLAQVGPLREEGRERHSDSRADHSEEVGEQRRSRAGRILSRGRISRRLCVRYQPDRRPTLAGNRQGERRSTQLSRGAL